ncbi:MAG TPA: hypothetical protein DCZ08_10845 [Anaerolineaceae bacterium]|nr:hypothetical protein [Anaerolineaceae bacterium]
MYFLLNQIAARRQFGSLRILSMRIGWSPEIPDQLASVGSKEQNALLSSGFKYVQQFLPLFHLLTGCLSLTNLKVLILKILSFMKQHMNIWLIQMDFGILSVQE